MDATATEATEQVLTPRREEKFKKIIEAHGATITSQEYNIPDTYDFSGFPERDRQELEGTVNILQNFLSLPIISDSCKNHEERRAMKRRIIESVPQEEKELIDVFIENNKMRRNKLSTLQAANHLRGIDNLPQDELSSHTKQLMSLVRQVTPHVSQDDIKQIVEYARKDGRNDIANDLEQLPQPATEPEVAPILTPLLKDPLTRNHYRHKIIDPLEGPTTQENINKVEEIADQVGKILNYLGNL